MTVMVDPRRHDRSAAAPASIVAPSRRLFLGGRVAHAAVVGGAAPRTRRLPTSRMT